MQGLRLLHALNVDAFFRVDAEHVTRVNKEGSVNGRAAFKGDNLGAAGCRITLNRRRCILHDQIHLDRDFEGRWLLLVDHDFNGSVLLKPLHFVVDCVLGKGETILWIARFAEPALTAVGVEVGCFHLLDVCFSDVLVLMERDFNYASRDKVAELGLVHWLTHLHAEDVGREDFVRSVLVLDNGLRKNFVVGQDSHNNKKGPEALVDEGIVTKQAALFKAARSYL